jgi:helicase MOV-10
VLLLVENKRKRALEAFELPKPDILKELIFHLVHVAEKHVTFKDYSERFHTLLFIEEAAARENIKRYDIESAALRKVGRFVELEVEGLAERRPSVLKGDSVLAFKGKTAHRGFVHEVMQRAILIRFNERFPVSGDWTIRFELNRTMFRRRHRALDHCRDILPRIISEHPDFQAELVLSKDEIDRSVSWRNGDMNQEQKLAVQSVLARSSPAAPPFILFGYAAHL